MREIVGNDVGDTSHGSILYSTWWKLPKVWQVGFNPRMVQILKRTV
jgi:hypothetical protein